jgi:uncharacterized protein YecE (DUF72 family)
VISAAVPGSTRDGGAVPNPGFLDPGRLLAELIEPFDRAFRRHTGPFVLELPPVPRELGLEPRAVIDRLHRLLVRLPRDFAYAVELRERRLLTAAYAAALEDAAAGHVYNYWSAMPGPGAQAATVPIDRPAPAVIRLLLRPGTWYEEQRERFRPFDRIVEPDEQMRDDVVGLIRRRIAARQPVFVLVNNKAEGSAPLTIRALAERLAGARERGSGEAAPGT